jgi:hypothetical protein
MKIIQLSIGDLDLERLLCGIYCHARHARANRGRLRSAISAKLCRVVSVSESYSRRRG